MQDHIISTAACYCGAVKLELAGRPQRIVNCHCGQCRRLSGAAFTTWLSFHKAGMRVLSGADSISAFDVTSNVTRHFCHHCGAHAYTLDIRLPTVVGVPAGASTDVAFGLNIDGHYFVDHKAAWFSIADDVAQFGGKSGIEPIRP